MNIVDTAEQLTAFNALLRTAGEAPAEAFHRADEGMHCALCSQPLTVYIRVPDLDHPTMIFETWCPACVARKGVL